MKESNAFPSIFNGFLRHSSPGKLILSLGLIPFLFLACGGKMSIEEARQVTVTISDKSLAAPPRRIDDILTELEQSGPHETAISKKFKAEMNKPRPQTDDEAILAELETSIQQKNSKNRGSIFAIVKKPERARTIG